jgi:hypothetical protein
MFLFHLIDLNCLLWIIIYKYVNYKCMWKKRNK